MKYSYKDENASFVLYSSFFIIYRCFKKRYNVYAGSRKRQHAISSCRAWDLSRDCFPLYFLIRIEHSWKEEAYNVIDRKDFENTLVLPRPFFFFFFTIEEINYQTKKMIYPWSHSKVAAELGLELWYPDYCALNQTKAQCQRSQIWLPGLVTVSVKWLIQQLFSWSDQVPCGWLMSYYLWNYLKPEALYQR